MTAAQGFPCHSAGDIVRGAWGSVPLRGLVCSYYYPSFQLLLCTIWWGISGVYIGVDRDNENEHGNYYCLVIMCGYMVDSINRGNPMLNPTILGVLLWGPPKQYPSIL